MILFNVLQNNDSFVIMSALDGLSDLAFDKGWRIFDAAITFGRMQEYQNNYDMPFYTEANFYLDFLQDEVMPEEEAAFLANLCTCYYEDNDQLNCDRVPIAPEELDDADSSLFENNFVSPDIGEEIQEAI